MKDITVVVPVYNVDREIGEFVESLNHQTLDHSRFSVTFVDDCSSDDSLEVIRNTISPTIEHEIVTLDEHSGAPGRARNIGLSRSTSEYVVFYDPDDVIPEYALEVKLGLIRRYQSEVLSGIYLVFNERGGKNLHDSFKDRVLESQINVAARDCRLGVDSSPALWTRIFLREFLVASNITFIEGIATQDAAFMFEIYSRSTKFSFFPIVFCYYRRRNIGNRLSLTHDIKPGYFSAFLQTRKYMMSLDRELYAHRKDIDVRFIISQLIKSSGSRDDIKSSLVLTAEYFRLIELSIREVPGVAQKLCVAGVQMGSVNMTRLLHILRSFVSYG